MPTAKSAIQVTGKMPHYPSNLAEDGLTNIFYLGPTYLPPPAEAATRETFCDRTNPHLKK